MTPRASRRHHSADMLIYTHSIIQNQYLSDPAWPQVYLMGRVISFQPHW